MIYFILEQNFSLTIALKATVQNKTKKKKNQSKNFYISEIFCVFVSLVYFNKLYRNIKK